MKEYICKEDLKGLNQYAFGVEELINDIPTVTKADICREFMKKVHEKFISSETSLTEYSHCTRLVHSANLVLAEMENEE